MHRSSRSLLRLASLLCVIVMALGLAPNVFAVAAGPHGGADSPVTSSVGNAVAAAGLPTMAGTPVPCQSLWPHHSNLKGTGLVDCIEYDSRHVNGADFRLFYPAEWADSTGWGANFLAPAMEAMQRSAEVYGEYGTVSSVSMVFALLERTDRPALADAGLVDVVSEEPCAIRIFPTNRTETEDQVRQTVAHEMFHCFQFWNLNAQWRASGAEWWVEGTAEYFSNVVYPTVNDEWRLIPGFDARSVDTPLTSMPYTSTVFWQYLGNEIGNDGILKLIGTLPTSGGEAEQQAALRAYPGFAELFQGFAQAYLDKNIADTGGGMLPVKPVVDFPPPPIGESTTVFLEPQPFVLYRQGLELAAEPIFTIATEVSGGLSSLGVRQMDTPGTWDTEMVPAVDCDGARRYVSAITSLAAAPEDDAVAKYVITATEPQCEPKPATDPCLIGVWEVREFAEAILASYASTNAAAQLTFVGTSGSLVYAFDGEKVTLDAEAFEVEVAVEIAGTPANLLILLEGSTSAPYHADAAGGTISVDATPNRITVLVRIILDGSEVYAGEIPELWQLVEGQSAYACEGDTLELSARGPDGQMLPPIALARQA